MSQERRVLIVDDCDMNRRIVRKILEADYELQEATDGEEALRAVLEFEPDIVLMDVMMPRMNGYECCRRIKMGPCGEFTQVILLTGRASNDDILTGYQAQADDYLVKPFHHDELVSKVRVQFRLRQATKRVWELNAELQRFGLQMEGIAERRGVEIVETQDAAVFALAQLAESRDNETGEHLVRMRSYAQVLAEELSRNGPYSDKIDKRFMSDLYRSSPLHDIGKVGIKDSILLKPGRLTASEFEEMKQHVVFGAETLESAVRQSSAAGFLRMASDVARYHHERFDGKGYCEGLSGQEIPLAARIVAVADAYDALTSKRVYKDAVPPTEARMIIEADSGKHFDPHVVEAFSARFDDLLRVRKVSTTSDSNHTSIITPAVPAVELTLPTSPISGKSS